jgi:hypothetical protein
VTSGRHARKVRGLVPCWWGIWSARSSTTGIELCEVRVPEQNPTVDASAVAQLLWRHEVLEELESRALAYGLRGKPRRELWLRLVDSLPLVELCGVVRERLKQRQQWRVPARLV